MQERAVRLGRALLAACREVYRDRLVSLALFGSWARQVATPASDIDVLLVADPLPSTRMKRVIEFEAVEEQTEKARRGLWPGERVTPQLSPVIKTPEEVRAGSPLFLDMTESRQLLFDRDRFLENYLKRLQARMRKLGSRRHPAKGGYYWEYKPGAKPLEVIEL